MAFDVAKFMASTFSYRTEDIELPDLAPFFPEGEKRLITVRGLSGEELARVTEYVEKYRGLAKVIEGLLSQNQAEKIAAIKESMGISEKVPEDFAKRLQMMVVGSVSPKFQQEEAVKFAQVFPIEFYQITNTITRLTGQGSTMGESKPSITE